MIQPSEVKYYGARKYYDDCFDILSAISASKIKINYRIDSGLWKTIQVRTVRF